MRWKEPVGPPTVGESLSPGRSSTAVRPVRPTSSCRPPTSTGPEGTGMTSLTIEVGDRDSDHPTWSPDSRWIAFSHLSTESPKTSDLYVVGRDGTQPRPIAVTRLNEATPSWAVTPPTAG